MAHGRRSGFAKKIDTVHWTLLQEASLNQSAGAIVSTAFAAQHLPETFLRIRGEWAANFSTGLAAGVGVTVTCGLILVPEGTGTTVLWSPVTDGDAPWVWWDTFALLYGEMVVDAVWSSNTSDARRVIDSKAMRKIRNTELQFVTENVTVAGLSAGSINLVITARALFGT